MATLAELNYLSTVVAYLPRAAAEQAASLIGWKLVLWSGDTDKIGAGSLGGHYQGYLLQKDGTNEFAIANRGTANLNNLYDADGHIAAASLGIYSQSNYDSSATSFLTSSLAFLANPIDPQVVSQLDLTGHSLGYSGALNQLVNAKSAESGATSSLADLKNDLDALGIAPSSIVAIGFNGAGVTDPQGLATGSLSGQATNFLVSGDAVPLGGVRLGGEITLTGAGMGWIADVAGAAALAPLAANPIGLIALLAVGAAVGGIAGNHMGVNSRIDLASYPALGAMQWTAGSSLSTAAIDTLMKIDPLTYAGLSDAQKQALQIDPLGAVNAIQQQIVAPTNEGTVGGVTTFRYLDGLSYTASISPDGTKKTLDVTLADGQPAGSIVIYPDRIVYNRTDLTTITEWNNGDSQFVGSDGVAVFTSSSGSGTVTTVQGTTFDFGPDDIVHQNDAGNWQIITQGPLTYSERVISGSGQSYVVTSSDSGQFVEVKNFDTFGKLLNESTTTGNANGDGSTTTLMDASGAVTEIDLEVSGISCAEVG